MVLTKSELIASLQNEVRILQHLITKIEPSMRDYRPTPKQRSTTELLQYLSIMGPMLLRAAKSGGFDPAVWGAADAEAKARTFESLVARRAAEAAEGGADGVDDECVSHEKVSSDYLLRWSTTRRASSTNDPRSRLRTFMRMPTYRCPFSRLIAARP